MSAMNAHLTCPVCGVGVEVLLAADDQDTVYGFGSLTDVGIGEVTLSGRTYAEHMETHFADPEYGDLLRQSASAMIRRAMQFGQQTGQNG